MESNFRENLNKYLISRIPTLFIIYAVICILANIPILNLFIDIFSQYKLQYSLIGLIFLLLFIYLTTINKKFLTFITACVILISINSIDLFPIVFKKHDSSLENNNGLKIGLFNVQTENSKYKLLTDEIKTQNPDIVILLETDDIWIEKIKDIKKVYPYYIEHTRLDNFGLSLYSKIPLENPKIKEWTVNEVPLITADFMYYNKKYKLYCIHTLPPVSYEYLKVRNEMLDNLKTIIEKQEHSKDYDNIIIAGDINSTVFSPKYKKTFMPDKIIDIQTSSGSLKGTWNSKYFPIFRISLDHFLITPNIKTYSFYVGNYFGSDHLPIFVKLK